MKGFGIIKGLGVTLKHIYDTYAEDIRAGRKRYTTQEGILARRTFDTKGIFTVNYPEEKVPTFENFRYVPFLVYDEVDGERDIRCTACGICSKVCPSQCIWISRASDPETGKPLKTPAEFAIDIDLCMNCGYCAEYCPFDAIKMDHDYELATYNRMADNIHHKERLLKPASYYAEIRPLHYAQEQQAKAEAEAKKAARRRPKKGGKDRPDRSERRARGERRQRPPREDK